MSVSVNDKAAKRLLYQVARANRDYINAARRTARASARDKLLGAVRSLIQVRSRGQFEHIPLLTRSVKIKTSKSVAYPGVNIYIDGPDVPVGQGKARRFWELADYAYLVFFGNYRTKPRRRRDRGRSATGNVRGLFNWPFSPFKSVYQSHGQGARDHMIQLMVTEVQKVIAKYAQK